MDGYKKRIMIFLHIGLFENLTVWLLCYQILNIPMLMDSKNLFLRLKVDGGVK